MRFQPRAILVLILALHCTSSVQVTPEDWPMFRGPNGTGVLETSNLPTALGADTNLAWRVAVPFARSSPIVVGERLFLTGHEANNLITIALDRQAGQVLWRREIVRQRAAAIYTGNDPASPTPVSDGSNVYVFFPDLGLVSYTVEGTERWRVPLGPFHSFYGMSSSPVVSGDLVVQQCDQQSKSFVIAVDRNTGAIRWRIERPDMLESFATPVLWQPPDGPKQILVFGFHRLDAYAVESGERRWWVGTLGYMPKGVPVIGPDMIYVSAPGGEPMGPPSWEVALKDVDKNADGRVQREEVKNIPDAYEHFGWTDLNGDGAMDRDEFQRFNTMGLGGHGLHALKPGGAGDRTHHSIRWHNTKTYPNVPAPLLYRGVLYTVKTGGIVTTLDPATGAVLKTGRAGDALGEYYSSPVAGDDKVYVISGEGKVTVLRAGRQWTIAATGDLGEETYATPALSRGRVYARTREALYCFVAR
jgi:outer membrane protein assembly factor BamB